MMGGQYDQAREWQIYWHTDIVKLMQFRHCMLEDAGLLMVAAKDKAAASASIDSQAALFAAADAAEGDDDDPED